MLVSTSSVYKFFRVTRAYIILAQPDEKRERRRRRDRVRSIVLVPLMKMIIRGFRKLVYTLSEIEVHDPTTGKGGGPV